MGTAREGGKYQSRLNELARNGALARLLAAKALARLNADREWLAATRAKLDEAAKKRDAGVAQLVAGR